MTVKKSADMPTSSPSPNDMSNEDGWVKSQSDTSNEDGWAIKSQRKSRSLRDHL